MSIDLESTTETTREEYEDYSDTGGRQYASCLAGKGKLLTSSYHSFGQGRFL